MINSLRLDYFIIILYVLALAKANFQGSYVCNTVQQNLVHYLLQLLSYNMDKSVDWLDKYMTRCYNDLTYIYLPILDHTSRNILYRNDYKILLLHAYNSLDYNYEIGRAHV